jgi:hypothetical protein
MVAYLSERRSRPCRGILRRLTTTTLRWSVLAWSQQPRKRSRAEVGGAAVSDGSSGNGAEGRRASVWCDARGRRAPRNLRQPLRREDPSIACTLVYSVKDGLHACVNAEKNNCRSSSVMLGTRVAALLAI